MLATDPLRCAAAAVEAGRSAREGVAIIYLAADDEPLAPDAARSLLAADPRVVRHTRAWIDDGELCLELECRTAAGAAVAVRMLYCWDVPPFRGANYLADVAVWALNGEWPAFRGFVQERLSAALAEQAAG